MSVLHSGGSALVSNRNKPEGLAVIILSETSKLEGSQQTTLS